jgi:CRP/FNR family transcriptional regulator, cyclic AMP receptor protein
MPDRDDMHAGQSPYDFLTGENRIQAKIEQYRGPLRGVGLFANLKDADLDLIARLVNEVKVEPNARILEQGSEGSDLLLIRSGSVRIEHNGQVIAHLGEGDYVGELSLLDGEPRSASVYAATTCDLLVIQKHTFDHVLHSSPALKDALLSTLCARLRELQEEVVP